MRCVCCHACWPGGRPLRDRVHRDQARSCRGPTAAILVSCALRVLLCCCHAPQSTANASVKPETLSPHQCSFQDLRAKLALHLARQSARPAKWGAKNEGGVNEHNVCKRQKYFLGFPMSTELNEQTKPVSTSCSYTCQITVTAASRVFLICGVKLSLLSQPGRERLDLGSDARQVPAKSGLDGLPALQPNLVLGA